MYYFKNFGLLLIVTGFLAACQATDSQAVDDSENERTVDTNKTKVSEDNNSTEESEEQTSENKNNSTEEDNIEQAKVEDEQLAKIIDKSTEIESYKAELNLEASLDEMEEESLNAEADVINGDPPQLRLRSAGEDRTLSRDGQTYFYNGQDWINVSDSVDVNLLYSVTYDQAVHSLETLFGYMTTEETDDKIIYKYHGNDEEVYRNLESLVQVNFGQMTVETVESSIEFVVDEERMLIEKINFDVEGKDTGGTFSLNGDTTFDNFNNIDQIELPNE
ncbi:hypothetical protein LNK15_02290 [Jeotgalicoccus huakuii]|uniref:hypothetical protein n=1 Tax=Jeotgalicoccus TaxID=227979 RepID=UPI0004067D38|nr:MULTISPECIES: hypothetical protein [Jeotgalicoccus]MCK1975884.1 hypothetical protein [Jeotgalicoccus huakuii]QQD84831.1 hypothetical protein JEM45_09480 [Jeotgalicoccus sp. ATCC 8456]